MVVVTKEKKQKPQDRAAQTVPRPLYRHDGRRTLKLRILIGLIVFHMNGYKSAIHYMIDEMNMIATTTFEPSLTTLLAATAVSPLAQTMHKTTTFTLSEADIRHGHTTVTTHSLNETMQVPLSFYKCTLPNGTQVSLPPVPRFIIVGAQKGGTTALGFLLQEHPRLLRSEKWEAHFFDGNEALNKVHHAAGKQVNLTEPVLCDLRNQYANYFDLEKVRANPHLLSYEKTPSYLIHDKVAERIKMVAPWAKIIVTLRNPVDRCFSHFKMKQDFNQIPKNESFAEHFAKDLKQIRDKKCLSPSTMTRRLLDDDSSSPLGSLGSSNSTNKTESLCILGHWEMTNSVHRGFYAQQLERFHHQGYRLGHNLLVFQYERFKSDPSMVLDEIMDFLDIPPHEYQARQLKKKILPVIPQNHTESLTLSQETRNVVHEFYKPYNDQLADLLGEEWRGIWDY